MTYCQFFYNTFQSKFIDKVIKLELALLTQLNISGCIKINMTENETKRAYELGIVALKTPEDDVSDEIKAADYKFKQMFSQNMFDCYLKFFYGN